MAVKDYLGKRFDAVALARTIERYWHDKGHYKVRAWAKRVDQPSMHWAVRSNIVYVYEKL